MRVGMRPARPATAVQLASAMAAVTSAAALTCSRSAGATGDMPKRACERGRLAAACMMSINVKEAYCTNLLVQYSSLQLQIFFPPPPPPPLLSPLPGNAGAVNRAARV